MSYYIMWFVECEANLCDDIPNSGERSTRRQALTTARASKCSHPHRVAGYTSLTRFRDGKELAANE